jgi:hypothetical protein
MKRLSDNLMARVFEDPQDFTNRPKMLRESNAIERPRRGNRAAIVMLTLAVALSLAFTAGFVLGAKSTNDYFQETHR